MDRSKRYCYVKCVNLQIHTSIVVKTKKKVELDLYYYATKSYLKSATSVEISKFAKKADLASLKYDIHKLDIDELEKVPNGLNNLKR